MPWDLNNERPIYAQIMERMQTDIVSGIYSPGAKLPSVRELAQEAAVNPNTMQKALTELERTGLVHAQRTSGRYITEDETMIHTLREDLARHQIALFLECMQKLGYDQKEAADMILSMPYNKEVTVQ